MTRVTLLVGMPGSGKSTWIKLHAGGRTVLANSPLRAHWRSVGRKFTDDDVRAEIRARLLKAIVMGRDVVIEAGLWRRQRRELVGVIHGEGAEAHVILFTNVDVAAVRNARRARPRPVPAEGWELPTSEELVAEGFDTVSVISEAGVMPTESEVVDGG